MKRLPCSLHLVWLLSVVAACGSSAAEVKAAHEARYKAPPATLFAGVKEATESNYKIISANDAALELRTEERWYTPEGQADQARGDNLARLQDNSINFSVIVRLVKADGDTYRAEVEPVALRLHGLSSKPEPLDMKDPSVPGWVHGKVESLQLRIHDRLKEYAVAGATVPAMVPATPAPAPGAGSPGRAAPEGAPPPAPAPAPAPAPPST